MLCTKALPEKKLNGADLLERCQTDISGKSKTFIFRAGMPKVLAAEASPQSGKLIGQVLF